MFGHDGNQSTTGTGVAPTTPAAPVNPTPTTPPANTSDLSAGSPAPTTGAQTVIQPSVSSTSTGPLPPIQPSVDSPDAHQPDSEPVQTTMADEPANIDLPTTVSGAPDLPAEMEQPPMATTVPASDPVSTPNPVNDDELLGIKQEALQQLSPLVDHLEQSPEEKFHTTMMMIQASDDDSLIQSAFEAAKLITDDKTRAQALLDIVNEINYFTQQPPAAE